MSLWFDSHYSRSHGGIPVSIRVGGRSHGPVLASNVSGYQVSRHIPVIRSPKKRLRPKTPTPPSTPKFGTASVVDVYHSSNSSPKGIGISTNTNPNQHSLSLKTLPKDPMNPEIPGCQKRLEWGELLRLREEKEGTYRLRGVAGSVMAGWADRHSEDLENDNLRYEYNFLSQTLNIQCMALPTHEALHLYFSRRVIRSLDGRFGIEQAENMAIVGGSGTSMYRTSFFNSV